MAEIRCLDKIGLRVMKLCSGRPYFLIGRNEANDLVIGDISVSGFHATLFRYADDLWLIDHSINGTHYNPESEQFGRGTQLANVTGTEVFQTFRSQGCRSMNESARLLNELERAGGVQKIPDFVPHKFAKLEDIAYIIKMIEDGKQAEMLCSCARKLERLGYVGVPTAVVKDRPKKYLALEVSV